MPVKIRLAQRGKKKNRTFRVIVADSRSPRDGKFIDKKIIFHVDAAQSPGKVEIDVEKAVSWLEKGAQPSERAQKILEISGAWAQWRSSKGEVVSIPTPPEPKIKSSSKAHNKKNEDQAEDTNEESTDEGNKGEEE